MQTLRGYFNDNSTRKLRRTLNSKRLSNDGIKKNQEKGWPIERVDQHFFRKFFASFRHLANRPTYSFPFHLGHFFPSESSGVWRVLKTLERKSYGTIGSLNCTSYVSLRKMGLNQQDFCLLVRISWFKNPLRRFQEICSSKLQSWNSYHHLSI